MIKIVKKDLLESNAQIIAHQVNTNGVMGAGVAKALRQRYPVILTPYAMACAKYTSAQLLGKIQLVSISREQQIANLFAETLGKELSPGRYTDYKALDRCFRELSGLNKSIALPYKIGCGLGGGDWSVVEKMIVDIFSNCDVEICSIEDIEERVLA